MKCAVSTFVSQFRRITLIRWNCVLIGALIVASAGIASDRIQAAQADGDIREIRFEIEINDTSTPDDDYFCWAPTPARIRMVGGTEPVTVTISNRSQTDENGGKVVFQENKGSRPTASTFDPMPSVELLVQAGGNWTPFWVAGSRASTELKDTEIVVTRGEQSLEVAAIPVMVRVRKDATTLSSEEIDRFLKALEYLHDLENGMLASKYDKYVQAHDRGFLAGIHRGRSPRLLPLFLAWHRAFLLSIERELQAFDASVTVPYWRFDRDDPSAEDQNRTAIFTPDFMGAVSGDSSDSGGFIVEFSEGNPISGWQVGNGPLTRGSNGTDAVVPHDRLDDLLLTNGALSRRSVYQSANSAIESRYHNGAHWEIGGVLVRRDSPADPLFFLLHANVDRAWAVWQKKDAKVRFDPNHSDAYHAQGAYPGPEENRPGIPYRKGSYAEDLMWPWGGLSGRQNNDDSLDDWPEMKFDMPLGPGVGGETNRPTPGDMIDYLDTRGVGTGIGVCYDQIKFQ